MKYLGQINLILRELGMNVGDVGKDILAHMVLEKANNPTATYEEICKTVKDKNIVKHIDVSKKRADLITITEGLSDQECAVLFIIEGLENHDSEEYGRNVIESYINKVYEKLQKSIEYEDILRKVKDLGLQPDNDGVILMVSMAYKYCLSPKISDNDMYDYLYEKCNPDAVSKKLKKVSNEPVEIVNGSNMGQPKRATESQIIKKEIDNLIIEASKASPMLSCLTDVKEIIGVILNI